ncbi:MAG TPA: STAS domain-containing protein [Herpetosiphonaceae bacterium]
MRHWLASVLRPLAADPEQARRELFLRRFLLGAGSFVGLMACAVGVGFAVGRPTAQSYAGPVVVLGLVWLGSCLALRLRLLDAAAGGVILFLAALPALMAQGTIQVGIGLLCLPILVSMLLAGRRATLAVSGLLLLAYGALVALEQSGAARLARPAADLPGRLIAMVAAISLMLGVSWLLIQTFVGSLRTSMAAMAAAEREAGQLAASQAATLAQLQAQTAEQQRLLALVDDLDAPILTVAAGTLVMPLIGQLTPDRLARMQAVALDAVAAAQARTVILDLTGARGVDLAAAGALARMARAFRLLGAETILSGISAAVARTLAELPAERAAWIVAPRLQEAVERRG